MLPLFDLISEWGTECIWGFIVNILGDLGDNETKALFS